MAGNLCRGVIVFTGDMFVAANSVLDLVIRIAVLGPLALLWLILVVRLIGLQSFSKMNVVDFIVSVATGRLLADAAVASRWQIFLQSCGAIAVLLAVQALFTAMRRRFQVVHALENKPVLLMRDGEFLADAMAANRVDEGDIWAKLREANVTSLADARAVVLEATGDISVLHGSDLDESLLQTVERA